MSSLKLGVSYMFTFKLLIQQYEHVKFTKILTTFVHAYVISHACRLID